MNGTIKQYEIYQGENNHPIIKPIKEFDTDIYPGVHHFARDIDGWMIMMQYLYDMDKYEAEHIFAISADTDGYVLGVYLLGIGDPDKAFFDQRNLAIFLLLTGATQFVIVHNHPNDVVAGSSGDKIASLTYKACGDCIGVNYLGLYAIGKSGFINVEDEVPTLWEDEKIVDKMEVICI